jgi:hypothetical protein
MVFACAPAAHAVTLAAYDGHPAGGAPIGGQWQAWADDAHIPTYTGKVILKVDPCGCFFGVWAPWSPTIYVDSYGTSPADSTLYHELGHTFDWQMQQEQPALGARFRTTLLHVWGRDEMTGRLAEWGVDDGLTPISMNEFFAVSYDQCAQHRRTTYGDVQTFLSSAVPFPPAIARAPPRRGLIWTYWRQVTTCRLIREFAHAWHRAGSAG